MSDAGFLLYERIAPSGQLERIWASVEGDVMLIRVDQGPRRRLPLDAFDKVMTRYGRPLAEGIVARGPWLDLGAGRTLARLEHRAVFDVCARSFLVYSRPGAEPLAELAVAVAGAVSHLLDAYERAAAAPAL